MGDGTTLRRVPALDGLRGLAVAGVLLFHGGLSWAGGGFLGVSTFFTLSGFLITSLLLVEHETTGTIALGRFWARRARRLLPALLLAIAGIIVLGAFIAAGPQATRLPGDAISALLYVANWRFVVGDQSYLGLWAEPSLVQHFWSLAIEEQFYLLYPLLVIVVLACVRDLRRGLAVVLGVLTVGSVLLGWLLAHPGAEPSRVYYGTDTRAAEMLVGGLLACLIGGRGIVASPRARRGLAAAGVVALALVLAGWSVADLGSWALYHGGLAGYGVLTAIVIAAAHVEGPVPRLLAWRPLRALGLISYGTYLFHWPIFLWLSADRTGLDGPALLALRLGVTLALATLSYRFVEQPIRNGARWRTRPAALLAPTAIAGLCLVVAFVPFGDSTPSITLGPVRPAAEVIAGARAAAAQARTTTPSTATTVAPLPARRVMVVGDSVASTLGRGLERWGAAHGVAVLNAARSWCPIARGGELAAQFGKSSSAGCDDWPERWGADLDRFHPDVVVVLTTVWDLSARRLPEWGEYLAPGDARFDRRVIDEWQEAVRVLSSRGGRVVWLTIPCGRDPALGHDIDYANLHYVRGLAAGGVAMVDLARHVCPGGQFSTTIDGVDDARPDGLHFSDPGADATARWLAPLVIAPRT
jgi:peptidoglycan/LPS O-acetylase OafA/YrhL